MFSIISKKQFDDYKRQGCNRIPLVLESFADLDTPLSVYSKLANQPFSYLLESVEGGDKFGRYSIIGLPAKLRIQINNKKILVIEEEEVITDRPQKVNITLDDSANPSLAPQRPKKIGMDLTGNIKNPGIITADMQGTIVDTMTKMGKKVKKGDSLFVLEAMKMEKVITAPIPGIVVEFNIKKGQAVNKGDVLVEISI